MTKLPAGLVDANLEVFLHGNELKAICNGQVKDYLDLPLEIRAPFKSEMFQDLEAVEVLSTDFKITETAKMEEQFVACRYGSLNYTPDFDGKRLKSDAPICDNIGTCKGFAIVCKVPAHLTRREYELVRNIVNGLQDIEISFKYKISVPTIRTHLRNIRQKIKVNNRVEIAHWASEKGIH